MRQVLIRRPNVNTGVTDMLRANVLAETADTVRVKLPGVREPKVFRKADVTPVRTVQNHQERSVIVERTVQSANSLAAKLY